MSTPSPTTSTKSMGGIPLVWLVVIVCACIVIGVCVLTYPLLLLNRWRLKEKIRNENEIDEDEDYEEPPSRKRKDSRGGGGGGGITSIFARGRVSTRGKWVERTDEAGQPYYEHTGTGEVTWTDPRPKKMQSRQKRAGSRGSQGIVVATMPPAYGMQAGYGAPGGFGGAPRGVPPPLVHTGSMGNMLPRVGSVGNMMQQPPRMPPPQQYAGAPMAAPVSSMPPAAPPPGMVSPPSIRRTQGGAPAAAPAPAPAQVAPAPAPAADPKFEKYSRMQKAGLPEGAIRNAMNRDGIPEADQQKFFG